MLGTRHGVDPQRYTQQTDRMDVGFSSTYAHRRRQLTGQTKALLNVELLLRSKC